MRLKTVRLSLAILSTVLLLGAPCVFADENDGENGNVDSAYIQEEYISSEPSENPIETAVIPESPADFAAPADIQPEIPAAADIQPEIPAAEIQPEIPAAADIQPEIPAAEDSQTDIAALPEDPAEPVSGESLISEEMSSSADEDAGEASSETDPENTDITELPEDQAEETEAEDPSAAGEPESEADISENAAPSEENPAGGELANAESSLPEEIVASADSEKQVFTAMAAVSAEKAPSSGAGSVLRGTPPVLPDGWYRIRSAIDQTKVVTVAGDSKSLGANIQLYHSTGGDSQKFHLIYDSVKKTYQIINKNSGLALNVANGSTANGANVNQGPTDNHLKQQWEITDAGNGLYIVTSKLSGKELHAAGNNYADNTNLELANSNDLAAQRWIFDLIMLDSPEPPAEIAKLADGTYIISSALDSSKVLEVKNGSTAVGANIQINAGNGKDSQKFQVIYDPALETYQIINCLSGKALNVANGAMASGTNVNMGPADNELKQQWVIQNEGNGFYSIISKLSNKVLDVAGGKGVNAANVVVNTEFNMSRERWIFTLCDKTISNGVYYLASAANGSKVVDIASGSKASGANAQVYAVNNSKAQQFKVTYDTASKSYSIVNVNSSNALNVAQGSTANGANVNQGTAEGWLKQKWSIVPTDDGNYTVVSQLSGKALTISGGTPKNAANLTVNNQNGSNVQKWMLLPVSSSVNLANGLYEISSVLDSSFLVSISGGSMGNSVNALLKDDKNNDSQRFVLTKDSDGSYRINNYNSGKLLTASSGNAIQKISEEIKEQRWFLRDAGNGAFYLENAKSGRYLDVASDHVAVGTNVQTATPDGSQAQKFYIKKQSVTASVPNGTYTISVATDSSQTLDIVNGSRKVNARLQTYSPNGSNAQKFIVTYTGDGYYAIKNVQSKHLLAVNGESLENGMHLHQEASDGSLNQRWLVHKNANGTYTFINAKSGKTMAANGRTNRVTQWDYAYSANRQFALKPTTGTDSEPKDYSYEPVAYEDTMWTYANKFDSPTPYIIIVDRDNFLVKVFEGKKGNWHEIFSHLCTVGKPDTPTTPGLQHVDGKVFYFTSDLSRAYYATHLSSGRYIHSVLYYEYTTYERPGPVFEPRLGMRISGGCVRLPIEKAQWIYDTIPLDTTVYIY